MGRFSTVDELGVDVLRRTVGHGPAALSQARERAELLSSVLHPGVLCPTDVVADADGAAVAIMPRIDGDDVAALTLARGGLRLGECVTLGIAAATALAAMHRAGIAHGDVSATNIMVSAARVTLVDTMAGAAPHEHGTPGFAAPERPGGASAPADVYALGRVLLGAVRGADRERLDAWVQPMLAPDPSVRPSAAMVARALESCAAPEAIERPMLGVADAMRAQALSAAQVHTERRDSGRWWRVRKRVIRWGSVAAICVGVLVLALGVVPRLWSVANPVVSPGADQTVPLPAHAAVPVAEAARTVTLARFVALADGDGSALLATAAQGSPALAELEQVAAAIDSGQLSVDGLTATVDSVEILSESGRRASARVTYSLSAHTVWQGGESSSYEPYTQTIDLNMVWSEAGWQVERVRAAPVP